jgi:hypothetical protein
MLVSQNLHWDWKNRVAALVIAHPGHELRVYHWLELAKPRVFVLTDGSGRSIASRLSSTTKILDPLQAIPGEIYGQLSDRQIYQALLNHDRELFINVLQNLVQALVKHRVEYVVGDAQEGYNPTHDLCRILINAAIAQVSHLYHQTILNFEFPLVGLPNNCLEPQRSQSIWLKLDSAALARKYAAAKAYPELQQELQQAIQTLGLEAFQIECLRPVDLQDLRKDLESELQEPPFYERYGEQQVAQGYYDWVIRYREHLYPLALALNER